MEAGGPTTDEVLIPVLRVKDAELTARWYGRLGFVQTGVHRFEPHLPAYVFLARGDIELHLSEHRGDAPKRSLVYFWVGDVDAVAAEFGTHVETLPWGRETTVVDPDGNRIRVATRIRDDG